MSRFDEYQNITTLNSTDEFMVWQNGAVKNITTQDLMIEISNTVDLSGKADIDHNHDGVYSPANHDHTGIYSPDGHDHAGTYSPANHDHTGIYEPIDISILRTSDVDDTPVNGATTAPVSSNWAFNHTHSEYQPADPTILKGTIQMTAGENVLTGDICYLKSDGKMWKANATVASTSSGLIMMAGASILANAVGTFIRQGDLAGFTSLTPGAIYYINNADGQMTTTAPISPGFVVRVIGYALNTTTITFDPSKVWVERV